MQSSSNCKCCASAQNSHNACIRHVACVVKAVFRPDLCQLCQHTFELAQNCKNTATKDKARKEYISWAKSIIKVRQARNPPLAQAKAIWPSYAIRESFSADWCPKLQKLDYTKNTTSTTPTLAGSPVDDDSALNEFLNTRMSSENEDGSIGSPLPSFNVSFKDTPNPAVSQNENIDTNLNDSSLKELSNSAPNQCPNSPLQINKI